MKRKALINIARQLDIMPVVASLQYEQKKDDACIHYCKNNGIEILNDYFLCECMQFTIYWQNSDDVPEIIRDYSNRNSITDVVIYEPVDLAFSAEQQFWLFEAFAWSNVSIHIVGTGQVIEGSAFKLANARENIDRNKQTKHKCYVRHRHAE